MKFDAPSIKNSFVRRSYLILISPFVLSAFVLISAYELIKAVFMAIYECITEHLPHNAWLLAAALKYSWIGKEEHNRRAELKKTEKVNSLTKFTITVKKA